MFSRWLHNILVVLMTLIAVTGSVHAKFQESSKTASGVFGFGSNIDVYRSGLVSEEERPEITIVAYDPATGVWKYVNQNPWTKWDPHGLAGAHSTERRLKKGSGKGLKDADGNLRLASSVEKRSGQYGGRRGKWEDSDDLYIYGVKFQKLEGLKSARDLEEWREAIEAQWEAAKAEKQAKQNLETFELVGGFVPGVNVGIEWANGNRGKAVMVGVVDAFGGLLVSKGVKLLKLRNTSRSGLPHKSVTDSELGHLITQTEAGWAQGVQAIERSGVSVAMARTADVPRALRKLSSSSEIHKGQLSRRFHRIKERGSTPGGRGDNIIDDVTGDVFDGNEEYIGNVFNDF